MSKGELWILLLSLGTKLGKKKQKGTKRKAARLEQVLPVANHDAFFPSICTVFIEQELETPSKLQEYNLARNFEGSPFTKSF